METFSTSTFKRIISLEYLLLPPRSTLKVAPLTVTHQLLSSPHAALLLIDTYIPQASPSFNRRAHLKL